MEQLRFLQHSEEAIAECRNTWMQGISGERAWMILRSQAE